MISRLVENFLWAVEVDYFKFFRFQKVAKNMVFGLSNNKGIDWTQITVFVDLCDLRIDF